MASVTTCNMTHARNLIRNVQCILKRKVDVDMLNAVRVCWLTFRVLALCQNS